MASGSRVHLLTLPREQVSFMFEFILGRKRYRNLRRSIRFLIIGLVLLYIVYVLATGFIWFIIQTILYLIMFMGLLIFLKKRGFFKDT